MSYRAAAVVGAAVLAVAVAAGPAGASRPTRVAMSMTCDRGTTDASAVVTVSDGPDRAAASQPTPLECGADVGSMRTGRVVVSTDFTPGYATIDGYEVTVGAATVTCAGEGTLPIKLACTDGSGSGATITVR